MLEESSKDFHRRLSQWVASQGIWFQLRYSMSSEGVHSRWLFQILLLGFRLILVLLLLGALFWGYLHKRAGSEGFSIKVADSLRESLSARDVDLRGQAYTKGRLNIAKIEAVGGSQTFFDSFEAHHFSCDMGLLDSLMGKWDIGTASIDRLHLNLRAGSNDDQSSKAVGAVIFADREELNLNTVEVRHANLKWGYSRNAEGEISGSKMRMQKIDGGWRLSFKGGKFSQNWFKNLDLVELTAICKPQGIQFEKALFTLGSGKVDFSGLQVHAGSRPELEGRVILESVDLANILPVKPLEYMEGQISGGLDVFGSTNSSEGVGFDGEVLLGGDDVITLFDKLPLLEALSVMDYARSYYRIDFVNGGFRLKTQSGGVEISELNLAAASEEDDGRSSKFKLGGGFLVRPPTKDELREAIADGYFDGDSESAVILKGGDMEASPQDGQGAIDGVADLGVNSVSGSDEDQSALLKQITEERRLRLMQLQIADRFSDLLLYQGQCEISLQGNAFERAGKLQELYPVDPNSGRIRIDVPLNGKLHELTQEQSKALYEIGRRQ